MQILNLKKNSTGKFKKIRLKNINFSMNFDFTDLKKKLTFEDYSQKYLETKIK